MAGAGTLVIGASQAGLQVAMSLRDLGATDDITLVGGETRPPYQRPTLSKAFLLGGASEDSLALRDPTFYGEKGIDLVSGEWVDTVRLTGPAEGAGVATTRSGRDLPFDHLALTVGGAPRRLHVPGHDLSGVHYLRDVDDAHALRHDLEQAREVAVVGGGFVGLEAAAAATAAGRHVTVVEAADRLLARAVAPVMSDFLLSAHRRRGTEVLLGTAVRAFTGTGRVDGVELADGRVLPADVVVVGIGLVAHTELAEQLGLTCENGVVVDEQARTSNPAVVAAGDCTVTQHPVTGPRRLESVQNAIAQAKTAAASLLGVPGPRAGAPWFWSDQGDLKLQIAGLTSGYDDVALRGDPASESFSVLYYCRGQLLSVDAVNAPHDYLAVRRILDKSGTVPIEAASDLTVPLKSFVPKP